MSARVRESDAAQFGAWRARLQQAVLASPGCLSCELVAASLPEQQDPVTVVGFDSTTALRGWLESPARRDLVAEGGTLTQGGWIAEIAGGAAAEYRLKGLATEVIVTDVKPGRESEYRAWAGRIERAQAAFPGYSGSFVQPPQAGETGWTTIMRFATVAELDGWLKSPERERLLEEARELIDRELVHRVDASFPGWAPNDPATGKPPPTWKTATLVLLVLYPVVMLEVKFLSPRLGGLNPALGTFIGNAISVSLTTWPLMPLAIRAYDWWIFPESRPRWVALAGPLALLACYALEMAALWRVMG